jgi:hypothetical protein
LRRAVVPLAAWSGLETYEPVREHRLLLNTVAEYREDSRPIRDRRPEMGQATIATEGLDDMLDRDVFSALRVLEVGPKHGHHSLWLDRTLQPSELVFLDFPGEWALHDEWRGELRSPHRFVYEELGAAEELLELEPFDLVLFLGVLYHSTHHIRMLATLNRVTRLGGHLLLQTTIDPRTDASLRLSWPNDNGKAKAVPTLDAVRLELAWTGWRRVIRFVNYRPGSSEAAFVCEKTDEIADDRDLAAIVTPHRQPVDTATQPRA